MGQQDNLYEPYVIFISLHDDYCHVGITSIPKQGSPGTNYAVDFTYSDASGGDLRLY